MHAPLSTDKQKYYQLMALVCEDLPTTTKIVDTLVRAGHEATSGQLAAVRWGRNISLAWLIDMVRVGMPDYSIPEELLPAPAKPAGVPLFH